MRSSLIWAAIGVLTVLVSIIVAIKYRRKPAVPFFVTILILLAAGITLLIVKPPPFLGDEFFRALGHAFIIAAILALSVDHYVKERVLREVSLDVSKYLVGYRLPEEVQNRIHELMQTKLIRRRFEIRCSFSEASNGKKLVAEIHIADELQNISSEPLNYQDSLEFERHELFTIHEMSCHSSDIAASYHYEQEFLKDSTTTNDTHISVNGKELKVPPVAQAIGISYRFQSKYRQTHPADFSDDISFKYPTIGVTVEITNAPKNYQFFVTPKADVASHHRWEYKKLFLPGERLTITWKRVSKKGGM